MFGEMEVTTVLNLNRSATLKPLLANCSTSPNGPPSHAGSKCLGPSRCFSSSPMIRIPAPSVSMTEASAPGSGWTSRTRTMAATRLQILTASSMNAGSRIWLRFLAG